jgi:hypothetical protein
MPTAPQNFNGQNQGSRYALAAEVGPARLVKKKAAGFPAAQV